MIEILSPAEVDRARRTGALVGTILQTLRERTTVGTNLLEVDGWTRTMIEDAGAVSCYVDYAPSFGRGPFGHHICTSLNDAVLHGRPHDEVLHDGDLLSLDLQDRRSGYPLEVFLKAAERGWRIREVDTPYAPRVGRSKVTGTVRGTLTAIGDMSRLLKEARR